MGTLFTGNGDVKCRNLRYLQEGFFIEIQISFEYCLIFILNFENPDILWGSGRDMKKRPWRQNEKKNFFFTNLFFLIFPKKNCSFFLVNFEIKEKNEFEKTEGIFIKRYFKYRFSKTERSYCLIFESLCLFLKPSLYCAHFLAKFNNLLGKFSSFFSHFKYSIFESYDCFMLCSFFIHLLSRIKALNSLIFLIFRWGEFFNFL